MSNKPGRRSRNNRPNVQLMVPIAMSDSWVIWQCRDCGGVHIHQFDPEIIDAWRTENEESPDLGSRGSHDHSLDLATESNNANVI
jgi:Zn-finger protein